MKKLFYIIIFILISLNSTAQKASSSPSESTLHFGLKIIPSLAWLRSDTPNYESDGSKFGFTYGLITEFTIAKNYSFVTGIDVSNRGGKFKSLETSGDTTIKTNSSYTLKYLEIPITLKFKTNEIGYLTYYLQAGVEPGVNLRARRDFDRTKQYGGQTATDKGTNIDIQETINNFNASMIIGGGIEYTLSGTTVILLGIEFNNGFLDIYDDAPKVNSNYLGMTIGILF